MRRKHLIIIVILLAFLLTAGIGFLWIWDNDPYQIELEVFGEQDITLEYGQEYKEPGAQASARKLLFGFEEVVVPVNTDGMVNAFELGDYEITYSAMIEDETSMQTRRVHIVDTTPPIITLTGGENYTILPGTLFEEPGFSAFDDYDGNLTENVEVSRYGDTITYTVSDSSGNTAYAHRKVIVQDLEAPVMTLYGEDYVEINAGGYYREQGCTATDNRDGEITHRIEVSGDLDVFSPGTYTINYAVADLFGNRTEINRTVCVKEVEGVTVAPYSGKNVYLTFDDGPSKYTEKLLDILAQYDIPATFFVVNNGYTSVLSRMAAEGHTVAMHAASHKYKDIYASEAAYFADLEKIQSVIETHTGEKPMLLRFPGGSSNTVSGFNKGIMTRLAKAVTEQGYTYFDWNGDSRDASSARSSMDVFYNVTGCIKKNENTVVLQHDTKEFSVDAVEMIIRWGLENGCRFLPLDANSPTAHHDINN